MLIISCYFCTSSISWTCEVIILRTSSTTHHSSLVFHKLYLLINQLSESLTGQSQQSLEGLTHLGHHIADFQAKKLERMKKLYWWGYLATIKNKYMYQQIDKKFKAVIPIESINKVSHPLKVLIKTDCHIYNFFTGISIPVTVGVFFFVGFFFGRCVMVCMYVCMYYVCM